MFLKGSLGTMSVSDVFQWIEANRKSGTLQIETRNFWKKLYFRDGFIFFASSNREGERLGQFLIRKGVLDEATLQRCLDQARQVGDVRKLSELLVERGVLTREQLMESLNELIQEIVYDSFLYESGDFEFRDGHLPDEVLTGFGLSPQEVAMEGLRRLDEYLRDLVSLPDESMILERTAVSLDKIESVLGKEGLQVFLLVDGASSTHEILDRSPFPVRRTQTLLLGLVGGGAVVAHPRGTRPVAPPSAPPLAMSPVQTKPSAAPRPHHPAEARPAPIPAAPKTPQPPASQTPVRLAAADGSSLSIEEMVGPPDTLLTLHINLEKPDDMLTLNPEEGFILSRISERCTVRELIQMAGTGKERGYKIVWDLIQKGYLQARRQS
jgi:uncharacterized protein DUF4388